MGRYVFKLPDVGEGTAEAEIVAWHVKVGDKIEEDQNLVDVMTDKATVEMTSPVTGVVVSLHGAPGEMATVGAPLAELDVEGAGNAEAAASSRSPPPPTPPPQGGRGNASIPLPPSGGGGQGGGTAARKSATTPAFATRAVGAKPLASPAVRR